MVASRPAHRDGRAGDDRRPHVQPRVRAGVLSTGVGGVNASFDEFTITVKGEPGHGAYPHLALDPISILATIVLGLSEIGARAIDPTPLGDLGRPDQRRHRSERDRRAGVLLGNRAGHDHA